MFQNILKLEELISNNKLSRLWSIMLFINLNEIWNLKTIIICNNNGQLLLIINISIDVVFLFHQIKKIRNKYLKLLEHYKRK